MSIGGVLLTTPLHAQEEFTLDMERIRAMVAEDAASDLPSSIHSLTLGYGVAPSTFTHGREGLPDVETFWWTTFKLNFPEQAVLIDPAWTAEQQAKFEMATDYDDKLFQTLVEALGTSEAFLATHFHQDHIGSVYAVADYEHLIPKFVLPKEQYAYASAYTSPVWSFPQEKVSYLQPTAMESYEKVFPGVVLIKAGGHTVGSQLIYVQLSNDKGFLFVGDIALHQDNITEVQSPGFDYPEADLNRVLGVLREVKRVQASHNVHVVVAHDGAQLTAYHEAGLIQKGF